MNKPSLGIPLKIGLIGLDTSHCIAFAQILQDENFKYHLSGAHIIGAYPGGSQAFSLSHSRVEGFTNQLHTQYGIPIYDSLGQLASDVNAMMLLSGDGRQHFEQLQHLACGKPIFIDKPLATTTSETANILRLATQTNTPLMSCSSLRFASGISEPLAQGDKLIACESFGPATILPDYPGLFWYGIHGIDLLFSWMGTGCQRVRCISHPHMDVLIGEWEDGRLGLYRGTRFNDNTFGCLLHTDQGVSFRQASNDPPYYFYLLKEVLDFFIHGSEKVSQEEMFEVIAFIEAAHQSIQNDGYPVSLKTVDYAML